LKEVEHYKDEVVLNEKKVDEMKRDTSKDIYDVRRYEDILNESYMMVPDSSKRLQLAITDLSTYIASNNHLLDLSGSWYQTAQAILLGNQSAVVDVQYSVTSYTANPVPETRIDDLAEGEAF
jgi:tubulin-specific chaperone A